MEFWKGNKITIDCTACGGEGWLPSLPEGQSTCPYCTDGKISGRFEMEPAAVAEAFCKAVLADTHDLRLKWVSWPRTRTVLDWMTASWGLNASWEDREGFERVLDLIDEDPELAAV
ncbi:MAG TPA: hypothetical protein VGI66_03730 [Streptosporangiaceae bacterium]|jgi:hypothetical protein